MNKTTRQSKEQFKDPQESLAFQISQTVKVSLERKMKDILMDFSREVFQVQNYQERFS